MTLNEAIREGCKKFPKQAFGQFADDDGGACVNGALGVATWGSPFAFLDDIDLRRAIQRYPEIAVSCACPVVGCEGVPLRCGYHEAPVLRVAAHLNNDHHWSRESIAEWADPHPELHLPMPSLVNAPSEPTIRCAT